MPAYVVILQKPLGGGKSLVQVRLMHARDARNATENAREGFSGHFLFSVTDVTPAVAEIAPLIEAEGNNGK